MTIVADHPRTVQQLEVTGGVDTHADFHVAAVIDPLGRHLGHETFPTTPAGYRVLIGWLSSHGHIVRVGVEGTGAYGAGLARAMHTAGLTVVEVGGDERGDGGIVERGGRPLEARCSRAMASSSKCHADYPERSTSSPSNHSSQPSPTTKQSSTSPQPEQPSPKSPPNDHPRRSPLTTHATADRLHTHRAWRPTTSKLQGW